MDMTLNPNTLIVTFKHFGSFGTAYEVIDVGYGKSAEEDTLRIHVFDTGEELDYPVRLYLEDIEA